MMRSFCISICRNRKQFLDREIAGASLGAFRAASLAAALSLPSFLQDVAEKSSSPGFTLQFVPSSISVVPGGTAQTLTVTVLPVNRFYGATRIAIDSLPTGVSVSPSVLSLTPNNLGTVCHLCFLQCPTGQFHDHSHRNIRRAVAERNHTSGRGRAATSCNFRHPQYLDIRFWRQPRQ